MSENIQYLNFDSLGGSTYNTTSNYSSYPINASNPTTAPNSFNAEFKLQTPLQRIKKIHLKSVEIPITWNNIRLNSKLNTIAVATTLSGGVYTNLYSISLADKNYNNIQTLLDDINTAFSVLYPATNIVFSNVNNYIRITSSSTEIFTGNIYVLSTNLSYLLGFRTALDTMTTRVTTTSTVYLLNIDNYINMYVTNKNTRNANGTLCHFKIPTNTPNGIVYYLNESNSYPQSIDVSTHIPIDRLNVVLTDRFGYSINSSGCDYSFTLGFEKDNSIFA